MGEIEKYEKKESEYQQKFLKYEDILKEVEE